MSKKAPSFKPIALPAVSAAARPTEKSAEKPISQPMHEDVPDYKDKADTSPTRKKAVSRI